MMKTAILTLFFSTGLFLQSFGQCNTNTTICTPGVAGPFTFTNASGNPSTCLDFINGAGTPNYAYIILYITTGGNLNLLIDGDQASGCLDVSIFDITGMADPCASLSPATEIGCNYASNCDGCNEFGSNFPCLSEVPAPAVNAGDVLMILVEDWGAVMTNFTLELSNAPGSAQTGPPPATITPAGPFCNTDPAAQLSAATMGGTWSGPGVSANGLFNPATAGVGTHTITYSVGTAPCDATDQINIVVNDCTPSCTMDQITAVPGACDPVDDNFDISGQLQFTSPPTTGQLIVEDCNGNQNTYTAPFASPFNYTITDIPSDGTAGCSVTAYFTDDPACTITSAPYDNPPSCVCPVDAGPDQTVCEGTQVTLTASGSVTYNWDNGVTDGVPFTPPVGTTTYTVTGTNGVGCIDSDQVNVTVVPLPNVDAGQDQTVCDNVQVTLNGSGATTYNWDNGVTDGVAFTPPAGTTTYTVTGTDAFGCSNTDQVDITVIQAPVVDAGIDQIVCEGTQVTLSGSGAVTYTWDNGVTDGTPFTPSVGTTTYTVTGTDGSGCSGTDQVDVTVVTAPNVDAGPDQTVCEGTQVTLSGSGALNYVWDNGVQDGVPFTPGVGTVTYTVTGTNAAGCVNTDQVNVTVNPIPNVYAGADITICFGNSVVLTGSGAQTYTWDNGVQDGVSFTPSIGVHTYTVTGESNGCTATDQVVVTVEEGAPLSFTADVLTGCEPLNVTFTNTSGGNFVNCEWDLGNGTTLTGCSSVSTVLYGGIYDVTLTTEDAVGCISTVTYDDYITVEDNPHAGFIPSDFEVSLLNTEVHFTNTSTGATTYEWHFGDSSAVSNVENPIHQFPSDYSGSYIVQLYAYSDFGCVDSFSLVISTQEELIFYLPNTFTPDGDEFNQSFQPIFSSGYDPYDFTMMIFNRWGEVIWESHDASVAWDGTYNGKLVKNGTYTWVIEVKTTMSDERVKVSGHVNVLK